MDKKNKKTYIIVAIMATLLLSLSTYLFLNKKGDKKQENLDDTSEQTETQETLSPEEVLENLAEPTSLNGNITMTIVSPEEENFEKGQARMWQAQLDGIEAGESFKATCHWQFYLNENNEEIPYEEMENSSIVEKEDPTLCGFTSTFINNRGKLRVKLTADIRNSYGEILETFTAERSYTVL